MGLYIAELGGYTGGLIFENGNSKIENSKNAPKFRVSNFGGRREGEKPIYVGSSWNVI